MCHCGNTAVEQTPNKSGQKINSGKKNLPPFLPRIELEDESGALPLSHPGPQPSV